MNRRYVKRVKELFNQGFSIPELAIMYDVSIFKVEYALENE